MLAGGVLQRNMKPDIALKNTTLGGSASGRPTQFEEVHPMAFAAHFFSGSAAALPGNPAEAHPRPGLFSRVLATLMTMQRLRAEAEVARFIDRNGGRITDDLEREISQRFGGPVA
jgi:hypothetical protein